MELSDLALITGYMIGGYAVGFAIGYFVYFVRRSVWLTS